MQLLLVTLHARIGMGIILVTHDVEERCCLAMRYALWLPGRASWLPAVWRFLELVTLPIGNYCGS